MPHYWIYNNSQITDISQVPEGVIGFVYKITDESNNKIYIGKKSLFSTRKKHFGKKQLKEITDKRKKTYEMITTVMPKWLEYTGSCKPLNESILKGSKYSKEIIKYCRTKQEMSYYEIKHQMIEGVIEPGNQSYNENILGKYYPRLFKIDDDE